MDAHSVERVNSVGVARVSADAERWASVGLDGLVRLHDAGQTRVVHSPNVAWDVSLSNCFLALNLDASISVFSALAKHVSTLANTATGGDGLCIAQNVDGTRALVGTTTELQVWDIATGRQLFSLPRATRSVAWKDGLIAAGGHDGFLSIYTDHGEPIAALQQAGWTTSVSISKERFATGSSDSKVRVWDFRARSVLSTFGAGGGVRGGVGGEVGGVGVGEVGGVGGVGVGVGEVGEVGGGAAAEGIRRGGHVGCVWDVEFSVDGRNLASVAEDGLVVYYETS